MKRRKNREKKLGIPVLSISIAFLFFTFIAPEKQNVPEPYALDYPAYFGGRFKIPKDNPMTREGVELGRHLFYEPLLSKNNQLSCATCHQQERAFTDGKALSEGLDGRLTKRNAMSLTNLLWVRNLFWDGRSGSLEEQAKFPLTDPHEMGQSLEKSEEKLQNTEIYPALFEAAFGNKTVTGENILKAIAQFERTLISANSPYDLFLREEYHPSPEELRGMQLFMTSPQPEKNIRGANCAHCHGGPKTFKELFHNNGLESTLLDLGRGAISRKAEDMGRFRVPTLRNIALTAPYMHDGRFETLEEVLDHYSDHVQESPNLSAFISEASNLEGGKQLMLSESEKRDIIAFLHMLTDTVFIQNPAFANPHPVQTKK